MKSLFLTLVLALMVGVGTASPAAADCCRYKLPAFLACTGEEITCDCNCGEGSFVIVITFSGGSVQPYYMDCLFPCTGQTIPEQSWVASTACTGNYDADWSDSCNPISCLTNCPYTESPWPVTITEEQCARD